MLSSIRIPGDHLVALHMQIILRYARHWPVSSADWQDSATFHWTGRGGALMFLAYSGRLMKRQRDPRKSSLPLLVYEGTLVWVVRVPRWARSPP